MTRPHKARGASRKKCFPCSECGKAVPREEAIRWVPQSSPGEPSLHFCSRTCADAIQVRATLAMDTPLAWIEIYHRNGRTIGSPVWIARGASRTVLHKTSTVAFYVEQRFDAEVNDWRPGPE